MSFLSKLFVFKKTEPKFSQNDMEICVHCGAVTTVPVSAPIEGRHDFISGCGQLCPECYIKFCSGTLDDEDTRLINAVLDKTQK